MNILELVAGPILRIIDKLVPDAQQKAQLQLEAGALHLLAELADFGGAGIASRSLAAPV